METTRVVLVCAVLFSSAEADFTSGNIKVSGNESDSRNFSFDLGQGGQGRHRLQMLFPLLIGISGRLAALIPTAIMGLIGIFIFVAFSKKAFIVSLIALFLTYLDRYRNRQQAGHQQYIHYHKNPFNEYWSAEELNHQSPEAFHYHWPHQKWPEEYHKKVVPFKYLKKRYKKPVRGHHHHHHHSGYHLPEKTDIPTAHHRHQESDSLHHHEETHSSPHPGYQDYYHHNSPKLESLRRIRNQLRERLHLMRNKTLTSQEQTDSQEFSEKEDGGYHENEIS